jgi:soluble lytic murein transglycosylase-like protein
MRLLLVALFICGCDVESASYHIKRFYGLSVSPSRSIIEQEINRVARKHRLSESLLRSLVQVESSFRPMALSKKGAIGLTQVMPYNAKRCGLHADELWDVSLNLACGAQILTEEIKRLGSIEKALTVYNCGKVHCKQGQKYAKKVLSLAKNTEEKT